MNTLLVGIRAVVFDAVGTLIHPDPPAAQVYAEIGERCGSRLAREVIRARFPQSFQRQEALDRTEGLRTSEEREVHRWRSIVAEVLDDVAEHDACFQQLYEHFARPTSWKCEPDAGTVLARLAEVGVRLSIASNFDRRLRRVVAGLPELRLVQHLVISSEVGWRKPAPLFFAALAETLQLSPTEILYVGDDWHNDYVGARSAGLRAVLFDPHGKESDAYALRMDTLQELLG